MVRRTEPVNPSRTRQSAWDALLEFMRGEATIALVTGTYQREKHGLALHAAIESLSQRSNLLFRTNSVPHVADFLSPVFGDVPLRGRVFQVEGGHVLYGDSMNPSSWSKTPGQIDVAVVYPIDSLDRKAADACLEDLRRRGVKKLFLVSWTDNKDFSWADHLEPVRIVFDAAEERPDYHERMMEHVSTPSSRHRRRNVPKYAAHVPDEFLVRIYCDGPKCHTKGARWARLNKPHPGLSTLRGAEGGEYVATCLRCGFEAHDNYNWHD